MSRRRKIVAHWDYLDGTQGFIINAPGEFDETYRLVDATLLGQLEQAHSALNAAEKAVADAYADAKEIRNPKYEEPEGVDG